MKPRVLLLSSSTVCWGAERSFQVLLFGLHDLGYETLLLHPPGALSEMAIPRSCTRVEETILAAPTPMGRPREMGLRAFAIWQTRVSGLLARYAGRYDIIYLSSLNLLVASQLVRRRSPMVINLHDVARATLNRALLRYSIRRGDRITSVSQFTAAQSRIAADSSIRVCPFGLDMPKHVDITSPHRPFRLLLAGRLDPEKGIEYVLQELVDTSDVSLRVVGAPSPGNEGYANHLKERSSVLGLAVDWHTQASDMKEHFAWCDAVVVANPAEPLGRTVLEAQTLGRLAFVPHSGGASEMVVDAQTGFKYDRSTPNALKARLLEVQSRPDICVDVSLAASLYAKSTYDASSYSKFYDSIFMDILDVK